MSANRLQQPTSGILTKITDFQLHSTYTFEYVANKWLQHARVCKVSNRAVSANSPRHLDDGQTPYIKRTYGA